MLTEQQSAKRPKSDAKPASLGRHRRNCTVCAHEKCEEIEADYVGWKSPALIAGEYSLADRASVYRHAHALGLVEKRKRNLRAALERIIEKSGEVEVTAAAVVAAVQAYAKINAQGQWIDRSEQVNLNDLFERMTSEELETYARDGSSRIGSRKPPRHSREPERGKQSPRKHVCIWLLSRGAAPRQRFHLIA